MDRGARPRPGSTTATRTRPARSSSMPVVRRCTRACRSNGVQITEQAYWPTIQASIEFHGTRVTVVDVHPKGPPQGMRRHDASVDSLIDHARALPQPRILAGDFNASPYNRTIHRVMDLGLDSAHERRGRGLATTWPNGEASRSRRSGSTTCSSITTIAVLERPRARRHRLGPQARRSPSSRSVAVRRARRGSRRRQRSPRTRAPPGRIQPRSRRSWNRRPAYEPATTSGARPIPSATWSQLDLPGDRERGDRQQRPEEERRGERRAHRGPGWCW